MHRMGIIVRRYDHTIYLIGMVVVKKFQNKEIAKYAICVSCFGRLYY